MSSYSSTLTDRAWVQVRVRAHVSLDQCLFQLFKLRLAIRSLTWLLRCHMGSEAHPVSPLTFRLMAKAEWEATRGDWGISRKGVA